MSTTRVALVGGSDALRAARRSALEASKGIQVIFDSDAFSLLPQDLLDINFDVAIVEQRLSKQTSFEFIKAAHSFAKLSGREIGRFLVSAQFNETDLRVAAVEAGAVDCVFVSDGLEVLIEKVQKCSEPLTDFAIRDLLPILAEIPISQESFQSVSVLLDTLNSSEAKVLKGFCLLKNDSEISIYASLSVAKVRATLANIQNLLLLDTRSQLLLRMHQIGALAL